MVIVNKPKVFPKGRHIQEQKFDSNQSTKTNQGETGNYEGKPKQEKQYMKEKELKQIV